MKKKTIALALVCLVVIGALILVISTYVGAVNRNPKLTEYFEDVPQEFGDLIRKGILANGNRR